MPAHPDSGGGISVGVAAPRRCTTTMLAATHIITPIARDSAKPLERTKGQPLPWVLQTAQRDSISACPTRDLEFRPDYLARTLPARGDGWQGTCPRSGPLRTPPTGTGVARDVRAQWVLRPRSGVPSTTARTTHASETAPPRTAPLDPGAAHARSGGSGPSIAGGPTEGETSTATAGSSSSDPRTRSSARAASVSPCGPARPALLPQACRNVLLEGRVHSAAPFHDLPSPIQVPQPALERPVRRRLSCVISRTL